MLSEADVISIAFDCTAHALSRSPRHGVTRDENIFLCTSSKTCSFFHGFATPTSRGEERGSRELLRDVKTSFQTKVLLVQSRVKFTSTRSRAYESRVREAKAERTADVTRTRRRLASVRAFARRGIQWRSRTLCDVEDTRCRALDLDARGDRRVLTVLIEPRVRRFVRDRRRKSNTRAARRCYIGRTRRTSTRRSVGSTRPSLGTRAMCCNLHAESPLASNAIGSKNNVHVAHLNRYRSVTMALMSTSASLYPVWLFGAGCSRSGVVASAYACRRLAPETEATSVHPPPSVVMSQYTSCAPRDVEMGYTADNVSPERKCSRQLARRRDALFRRLIRGRLCVSRSSKHLPD